MKHILFILIIAISLGLTSCDPVHDLQLQNQTNSNIEVVFYPSLGQMLNNKNPEEIEVNGIKAERLMLDSGETLKIGHVIARYNPNSSDIAIDYLEIRFGNDTLKLIGKKAIFSTFQKVKELDWRLIVSQK